MVCAPSNAAVDVLLVRTASSLDQILGESETTRLLHRANATFRAVDEKLARTMSRFSTKDGNGHFSMPERFDSYRVIFCTLSMAFRITNVDAGFDNPDVIIVDEACQADEPEALLPLANLSKSCSSAVKLVLAGDPRQLGAVLVSENAKKFKLDVSLLERLMQKAPYAPDKAAEFNSEFVVRLVHNYRSHFTLLLTPSRLFYDDKLVPSANPAEVNTFIGWKELPNSQVPLIFQGVQGVHVHEGKSPSFANIEECVQVLKWIDKIFSDYKHIKHSDVGVVSPYVLQCAKIREALRKRGMSDIRVGTVENFQGDERKVIIISTVRSIRDFQNDQQWRNLTDMLLFDKRHDIGFLRNPKRFNVAITRACSLMVVVGNPVVLAMDKHWRALIKFAKNHGCFTHDSFEYTSFGKRAVDFVAKANRLRMKHDRAGNANGNQHVFDDDDDDDVDNESDDQNEVEGGEGTDSEVDSIIDSDEESVGEEEDKHNDDDDDDDNDSVEEAAAYAGESDEVGDDEFD